MRPPLSRSTGQQPYPKILGHVPRTRHSVPQQHKPNPTRPHQSGAHPRRQASVWPNPAMFQAGRPHVQKTEYQLHIGYLRHDSVGIHECAFRSSTHLPLFLQQTSRLWWDHRPPRQPVAPYARVRWKRPNAEARAKSWSCRQADQQSNGVLGPDHPLHPFLRLRIHRWVAPRSILRE